MSLKQRHYIITPSQMKGDQNEIQKNGQTCLINT